MIRCVFLFAIASLTDAFSTEILVANNEGVRLLDIKTQKVVEVMNFSVGANAVNFHSTRREIYVILNLREHPIVRLKFPGEPQDDNIGTGTELYDGCENDQSCKYFYHMSNFSHPSELVKAGNCPSVGNLVVDWEHDKLYWTCRRGKNKLQSPTLNIASLIQSENRTVLNMPMDVVSLDIDPYSQKLFWIQNENLVLISSGLSGENPRSVFQFDKNETKSLLKIGLDIHNKRVFVVGIWRLVSGDSSPFLASMNYEGEEENFYTCANSGWKFGLRSLNRRVFWLSTTANGADVNPCSVAKNKTNEMIDFTKVHVGMNVIDWRIFDPDVQIPTADHYCNKSRCSHSCHHVTWQTVQCDCPSDMTLSFDNNTCTVSERSTDSKNGEKEANPVQNSKKFDDIEVEKSDHTSTERESDTLGGKIHQPIKKDELENSKPTSQLPDSSESQSPKKTSTNGKTTSPSDESGSRSSTQSADGVTEGKFLVVKETAEAATTVTASTKSVWSIFILVGSVWFCIFIIVIIIRKRARRGEYEPSSSSERTDIVMS